MRKLMLSLDKKILDKDSRVAKRMIEYGKHDELFIVIPAREEKHFDLSPTVHVRSTGGRKTQQFARLKKFGLLAIKKGGAEEITTQDPFVLGLVGKWLKGKTGKKLEIQLHGDFYSSGYYQKSSAKNHFYHWLGKRNLAHADRIRVVGERIKSSLVKMNIPAEKITVNPIKSDNLINQETSDYKFPEANKLFLALGRLESVKNISFLINIWKKLPKDYALLIVGEGSEEEELKKMVKKLGLSNVYFEKWTHSPTIFIKKVDAVLFPSLSEGYGLVPMEAHALGTPVIMNGVGVANYELKPSEKVRVLKINDKEAWIKAIKEI